VKDVLTKVYPLGVVKDEVKEPWFNPGQPTFEAEKVLEVIDAQRDKVERFCKQFPAHLDPSDVSVKLAGAGGDGAQTAAMLLTRAAIAEGFDSTHIPSYGPESRGGTSYADVHIAKEEVLSPGAPNPHVLVAFNAPSLDKFVGTVREGGIVIYDSSVIAKAPEVPKGVKLLPVPCATLAQGLGNVVVKNVVALGALQEAAKLLTDKTFLGEIDRSLKHKDALIPLNEAAYKAGAEAVRALG